MIEKELLKATNFKKKTFKNRQDYLAAIVRAVNGLENDDFDQLSNEAADWFNQAVRALNSKNELPDFQPVAEETVEEPDEEIEEIEEEPEPDITEKLKKLAPPISAPETDKYGAVKGSKNSAAIVLLEKGCKMNDLKRTLGGTYYNLMERLIKNGHRVEKFSNGLFKLTHKSDIGK